MILSGRLADWSVADLVQIVRITRKSASLRIQGPDRGGVLYFDQGMLVGAEVDGAPRGMTGPDRLVEAVYLLQLLPEGSFDIGSDEPPPHSDRHDPIDILDRSQALLEAESDLRTTGLLGGGVLRLATERGQPVTIEPEHWDVIARLIGDLEFTALERMLGRPGAVAFAGHLHRRGLVEDPHHERGTDEEPPLSQDTADPHGGDVRSGGDGLEELAAVVSSFEAPSMADEAVTVVGRAREMRSLITPAETTLVPGVLDDIRQRFRTLDEHQPGTSAG